MSTLIETVTKLFTMLVLSVFSKQMCHNLPMTNNLAYFMKKFLKHPYQL
jgi:hypothetical protein